MPYQTRQQQAVLHCLERRPEESLSAADIAQELRREACSVGLATIYRQLERLESAGMVHKVNTPEGAYWRFCPNGSARRDCFLLKCQRCGRIRHLDCAHLQGLYEHLEQEHHFRVDPRGTLFTGLCDQCAGEEDAHGAR